MKGKGRAFWKNGFLVVADAPGYKDEGYAGVYGVDWPLQDFENLQPDKDLGIPTERGAIWVATNLEATHRYWEICVSNNITARLLLIETVLNYPVVQLPSLAPWEFVGYDLAFMTGNFYSAIQQELIGRAAKSLRHWESRLNKHRLFDDIDTAYAFLQERLTWVGSDPALETYGDFLVTRVSRFRGLKA